MLIGHFITLLAATTAFASALEHRKTTCAPRTENFDQIKPTNPLGVFFGNVLPLFNSVGTGTYGDLNFGNTVLGSANTLIPGMQPKSPPYYAGVGVADTVLRSIFGLLGLGLKTKLTVYPISTIAITGDTKSFDLCSMYLGCVVNTVTPQVGLPQACGITITAKDVNNNDLPTATASFGPDQVVNATMVKKAFLGWNEVVSMNLQVTSSFAEAPAIFCIDDMEYCVRK